MPDDILETEADVVVVGGGSAGSTAAIGAQRHLPLGRVVLLEKAHVKRSGAIAIGMDGLNNAVIPGHATPEQYVKEITMANDGIVNQRAVLAYAERSFDMIQQLDSWGVKFQKTESGDFDVKKVHHNGSYVLPMPEGYDLKKILTRMIRRSGVRVSNRVMATRLLTNRGRVAGVIGFGGRVGGGPGAVDRAVQNGRGRPAAGAGGVASDSSVADRGGRAVSGGRLNQRLATNSSGAPHPRCSNATVSGGFRLSSKRGGNSHWHSTTNIATRHRASSRSRQHPHQRLLQPGDALWLTRQRPNLLLDPHQLAGRSLELLKQGRLHAVQPVQ